MSVGSELSKLQYPLQSRVDLFQNLEPESGSSHESGNLLLDSGINSFELEHFLAFQRSGTMSEKKVIAVMGATGAQGGGLVRAILDDGEGPFSARAITRDASSDKAQALALLGAEVVEADMDDQASLERAFEGAHGAFCVTAFWETFSPEKEIAQARTMAEAAKTAGVSHVIWSTLEDTRKWVPVEDDRMPTLQGKYKVPHFDGKGEADAFFREAGVPTTNLLTSFYWENFISFGSGPQRGADGTSGPEPSHGRSQAAVHRSGGHRTLRL